MWAGVLDVREVVRTLKTLCVDLRSEEPETAALLTVRSERSPGLSVVIEKPQAEFAEWCFSKPPGVHKDQVLLIVCEGSGFAVGETCDFEGFKAHAKTAQEALKLVQRVEETVLATKLEVVFTGRGFGGGVALLAAIKLNKKKRVRAVAFAPPPVLAAQSTFSYLESYFVNNDLVPCVSSQSLDALLAECKKSGGGLRSLACLAWHALGSRAWTPSVRHDEEEEEDLLTIPGAVYRVVDGHATTLSYSERTPRISLKAASIADHAPPAIRKALKAMVLVAHDDALLTLSV